MRLIDADALKYDIVEEGQRSRRYKLSEFWELNRDEIWKVIDAQPTIDPERKTGKWIDQDEGAFYPIECSECHNVPLLDAYGDCVCSDYCPNCGAKMEETE